MINGEFCPNFPILTKCSKIDPVLIFIALLTTALVTIFIIPDNSKKLYEGLKRKLLICDTWPSQKLSCVPQLQPSSDSQTHSHLIVDICILLYLAFCISDLESVWCFPIANTMPRTASSRAAPHQDNWSQSPVLAPCKTCLITINKICTVVSHSDNAKLLLLLSLSVFT